MNALTQIQSHTITEILSSFESSPNYRPTSRSLAPSSTSPRTTPPTNTAASGAVDHTNELDVPDDQLTHRIIGAAIEVHRHLGPGLFESIYERALQHELGVCRLPFRSQVAIPMTYKGVPVGDYFADVIIANRVIVELKSVSTLNNSHITQVLSYLGATHLRLGLLINFNVPVLVKGVKRVIR